ncbi:hypothetical protein DF947_13790 [Pedobacter paludis]|uniref:Transposase IS200-like domain-containing protein n=1 Tax=Pedobacter paludis TaxID=2203212 RepID=A0A317F079_9SPHI|nr:hypothetical protein DF947_13790 [Pedobacter paludis]
MNFNGGTVYHIYNRGNNSQQIFFNNDNYLFFLRKLKKELLPFCNLLCYCLMPNHFHLMIVTNEHNNDLNLLNKGIRSSTKILYTSNKQSTSENRVFVSTTN